MDAENGWEEGEVQIIACAIVGEWMLEVLCICLGVDGDCMVTGAWERAGTIVQWQDGWHYSSHAHIHICPLHTVYLHERVGIYSCTCTCIAWNVHRTCHFGRLDTAITNR